MPPRRRRRCAHIAASLGPIDLAVLNAGVWEAMSSRSYSAAKAAHSMAVNYMGIANGVEALLPGMLERGQGHLALVASVAGYRGMSALAAGYGASKAAVINLAESLRHDLPARGIAVSLINPGYVATPMTSVNRFPMPFMIVGRGRGAAHRPRAGKGEVRDRLPLAAGGADEARPPAALFRVLLVRAHGPGAAAPQAAVGESVRGPGTLDCGSPALPAKVSSRSISCAFLHRGASFAHSTYARRCWSFLNVPAREMPEWLPIRRPSKSRPSRCGSWPRDCRRSHELPKKQVMGMLEEMVGDITKHLKRGARIRIGGLGILQVRKRPARMGRNPATGEAIKIKASKKVAFRAAKDLKEAV